MQSLYVPEGLDPGGTVVCAAHPTDDFGAGTAELLAAASGAQVVCATPRGVPLAEMVDEIDEVRQRLGLGRWLFWGLSGGGWLAQLYAHRHPDALTGIIVESACACFRERLADPACILSPLHPAWRGALDAGSRDAGWDEVAGVGLVLRGPDGAPLLVSPVPLDAPMRSAMPELLRFDARAWLPSLRLPVLVIAGTADPVVPLARARAVHEAIPGSRFVAVEGAGHVPVTEHRAEVAAAVRKLIAEIGA